MKLHFLSTGPKFPYAYYLGVMTALKVYGDDVTLWLTEEPKSKYFELLKNKVTMRRIKARVDWPALEGQDDHFKRVCIFDHYIWKIVTENGGVIMGLDSITLKRWDDLLGDKEMMVPIDYERWQPGMKSAFSMHGVIVKVNSQIARAIYEDSKKALSGIEVEGDFSAFEDGKLRWGGAGIIPYLNHVGMNLDKVAMADYGLVGGYEHNKHEFYLYERDGKLLHSDARTIPLYASSKREGFVGITEDYVANSDTLLSRLVKGCLTEEELYPSGEGYRFHLLGLVHLPVSERYMGCAFTQKIVKLAKMLIALGHEVILYGAEGSDALCSEFVQTHTLKDIRQQWGDGDNRLECDGLGYDWRKTGFRHDFNSPRTETTQKYYRACIDGINHRKRPDDFLLVMQGTYQRPISNAVNLWLTCEPGIGYRGSFSRFRAFESAYLQNFTYGSEHPKASINGHYYDRVIPNYFDHKDFPFLDKKEDYFLYIGRLVIRKGVMTAVKATEAIDAPLILAGQQSSEIDVSKLPPHCHFIGYVEPEQRASLMGKARAIFVPTLYLEAFGGVNVEAQLCGTPAITTSFGCFPETVQHGVTGFCCDTLQDFVDAAHNVDKLDPRAIRRHAERYLMGNVQWEFQKWFQDLHALYESAMDPAKKGWHRLS